MRRAGHVCPSPLLPWGKNENKVKTTKRLCPQDITPLCGDQHTKRIVQDFTDRERRTTCFTSKSSTRIQRHIYSDRSAENYWRWGLTLNLWCKRISVSSSFIQLRDTWDSAHIITTESGAWNLSPTTRYKLCAAGGKKKKNKVLP